MSITKVTEIPTIDCCLVTIEPADSSTGYALDTASKIGVEPQIETEEAKKLVVKGVLKAQKPEQSTLTGNVITLTDNVFAPEVVKILQGGTITYDEVETTKVIGYTPPVAGSSDKGKVFTMKAYSAQYDASGQISSYECIAYPNCQGAPVSFASEDGAFRAPEYKITSAPKTGEAPYAITYVAALPTVL